MRDLLAEAVLKLGLRAGPEWSTPDVRIPMKLDVGGQLHDTVPSGPPLYVQRVDLEKKIVYLGTEPIGSPEPQR